MTPPPSIVPRPAGEAPKATRVLLEDIHRRSEDFRRVRGVLDTRMVERISFLAALVSILVCSVVLLAVVWEWVPFALGLKVVGSVLIVLVAILTFRSVNQSFGE